MKYNRLSLRGHKYFYRLLLSFAVIVFSLTIFMGVVSTRYFTLTFRDELISVNQKMLYHLDNIIEEGIFKRVQRYYDNLAIGNKDNSELLDLFSLPLEGNFSHVKPAYDYLYQLAAANADLIDSIHIYYTFNDIVISSRNGLVYPKEGHFPMDNEWLELYRQRGETKFWLPVRTIDSIEQIRILSLVKSYPAVAVHGQEKGVICINFFESALREIIGEQMKIGENILVLDENNRLITSSEQILPVGDMESDWSLNPNQKNGNIIQKWMGVTSLFSYITMETNGWKIVNITPMELFLESLAGLKRNILLISLASIFAGLIVTVIFSSRMYTPMRMLLDKVKGAARNGSRSGTKSEKDDEYLLINDALDNLTLKVNTLEHTLEENKPLIKHNIVTGLFRHIIRDNQELNHRLSMIGMSFDKSYFSAHLIILNKDLTEDPHGERLKSRQTAKYNLIKIFENFDSRDTHFLATEISEYEIGIIMNSIHDNIESYVIILRTIMESIFPGSNRLPTVLTGSVVDSPLALHSSYEFITNARKYTYFLPDKRFLSGENLVFRESSLRQLPDTLIEEFSKGLNLKRRDLIKQILDDMILSLKNEDFSYAYGIQKIQEILTLFSDYIRDLDINLESLGADTVHSFFRRLEDIDQFHLWFPALMEEAFLYLENRSQNKNNHLIEVARKYIQDNIESGLYLDNVAAQINIKPQYLSKLFKEFTGSTFVSYVNNHKMERAAWLLREEEVNIINLAERLSFSSSAYFIKKFKAAYGMTPGEYREKFLR
jgi:two-component system response regulator YesN